MCDEPKARRRLTIILAAAVGIVIIGALGVLIPLRMQFERERILALEAYHASRSNARWPIDGYEFATRGIPCGVSEQEVDAIIPDANEKSRLVRTEDGDFAKLYRIVYQPEYRVPWSDRSEPIVTETFFIRFKLHGGAYRLERTLAVTGGTLEMTKWDLCSKQRIK